MAANQPTSSFEFGVFHLDLAAGELRKQGVRIKLQQQPLQVLQILLNNAGRIVTKEELQKHVWPSETFVDFDHGLYSAITRLREALSDSPETPRFIETVPRRGYRFVAPVKEIHAANGGGPGSSVTADGRKESFRRYGTSALAGLVVGGLLLALGLGFNIGGAGRWLRRASNRPVSSLAVLPLRNLSGDPAQEYFADGMTEQLITNLAQLPNLRVISRTSVMPYQGTKKPLQQIGRELNVDAVVEGSVMRSGQRFLITVQLLDARTDTHLWAQSYEKDLSDVLILQGEISRSIADEIQVRLSTEQQSRFSKAAQVDPEEQEIYLEGRYHLNKGGEGEIRKAIEYFQQAISKSPRAARSYAALAECYLALDDFYEAPEKTMPRATEAAQRAVELDANLAEAHTALGAVHFLSEWNWAGAEKEFRQALQLNPGSANAHMWYAEFLAQMGRSPDAIFEIKRAEALDPLSLAVHIQAGWVFYLTRQDNEALAEWRKSLELEPKFAISHISIWAAYLQKSEFQEIVRDLPEHKQGAESAVDLAALAGSYAAAGKRSEAEHTLTKLTAISKKRYVCPYEMGTAYAMLGNKDEALGWLQEGYRVHSGCMPDMKTDPRLDLLRTEPRFQELLRRFHFPQ
jgi:TolB-like protein/DNA-binding winged helix-turn-helix (wHTH) protein/tetratricopeptide (TPR) repeat protein